VSVQITHLSHHSLAMIWSKSPTETDVQQAYRQMTALLNQAAQPMFVMVDISCNPHFPMSATVKGALMGPHRHPNLRAWLVVGTSTLGHMIAHVLTAISSTSNIVWFATEAEALAYMAAHTASVPDQMQMPETA
jgi:hypothetical protein